MEKLVTIIVPVYNVEQYLYKCLKSILNQSYSNLEIILVDDGSVDKSGEICDEYGVKDSRIRVFHKKNGGVSSARNMGISNATGYYVLFIDPDDTIEEHYVRTLVDCVKGVDIAFCGINNVDKYGNITRSASIDFDTIGRLHDDLYKMIEKGLFINIACAAAKILKKEVIDKYRLTFDESYSNAEDYVFNLQYYKYVDSYRFIDACLYNYYHHDRGSACEVWNKKRAECEINSVVEISNWLGTCSSSNWSDFASYEIIRKINIYFSVKKNIADYNDFVDYATRIKQAFTTRPEPKSLKKKIVLLALYNGFNMPLFLYYYVKAFKK